MNMTEQRIAKTTRKVMVTLRDGRQLLGEVFLGLYGVHHTGEQQLGELLNGEEDFIPFKTAGVVSILNTEQILMVKTDKAEEEDDLMTLGKKYLVKVETHHIQDLQGEIYVNLPENTCRVRDWLNQPIPFLQIFLPDAIIYLNRRHIISVQD